MHIKVSIAIFLLSFVPGQLFGNVEPLTEREQYEILHLMDLCWVEDLSENQGKEVVEALHSEKSAVLLEAIKVVAIHRLSEASSAVLGVASDRKIAADRAFAEIVARGLASKTDMDSVLKNSLSDTLVGDDLKNMHSDVKPYMYVRGMITSVLVIDEARSFRLKLKTKPHVERLELSNYEKELLKYSKMKKSDAINSIIKNLRTVKVLSSSEYDLVFVLQTYGAEAAKAVINELSDPELLSTMSGYGKTVMLRALQNRMATIEDEDMGRLRRALQVMKGDEFGPLVKTIAIFENQIQQREKLNRK